MNKLDLFLTEASRQVSLKMVKWSWMIKMSKCENLAYNVKGLKAVY